MAYFWGPKGYTFINSIFSFGIGFLIVQLFYIYILLGSPGLPLKSMYMLTHYLDVPVQDNWRLL